MMSSSAHWAGQLALAVYVLTIQGINLITLLIADFYQKKFEQPSPRLGFLISIFLGIAIILSIPFYGTALSTITFVQSYMLAACASLSLYSTISLHFTMRRVRK
jgi:hypothetical protein